MNRRGGLGRGLDALIPGPGVPSEGTIISVPISRIQPNPSQPRQEFDPEELAGLADSIRAHGILSPLIVTGADQQGIYTLIAGERRLRAAAMAGLEVVPSIIREADQQQRLELALIENIQRADLQPLETAEAYQQLAEEFGLSHEQISERVGKSRVTVTNTMRLLQLAPEVKDALSTGLISEGHARALLGLNSVIAQASVLKSVLERKLSVRQTEDLVRFLSGARPKGKPRRETPAEIRELENRLRGALGTRVSLNRGDKGGSLVIYFYSDEELNNLVSQILGDAGEETAL